MNAGIHATVKRYADAWAAGDVPAALACYHDDVVFHYFGQNPLAGTHRGKAACVAVLQQVMARTNRKLTSIDDVLAGDVYGLIVAVEQFERDGRTARLERLLRYTVKDGKLSECWVHDQDQRLVDAFLA